jgi:BirA family biotin operon repressor/biotin-[acetyl-CoA-carboxylase] ligase
VTLALPPGIRLIAFERVESTNDEARRLAQAGEPAGALVWAQSQTQGRGRLGRSWQSPPGNLYLSLLRRPACAAARGAELSFVASVATCRALERLIPGAGFQCKWPNDVLLGRRKLAGILLESESRSEGAIDWLIVGVGVNVASHPKVCDSDAQPATSLAALGLNPPALEALIEGFAGAYVEAERQWLDQGFAPVRAAWLERAAGVGESVEVTLAGERIAGIFRDLTAGGELVVSLPDGGTRCLAAGEVRLVRRRGDWGHAARG